MSAFVTPADVAGSDRAAGMPAGRSRTWRGTGLPRPRLTVVPKVVAKAPRVPFVVLVVAVLGAGLVGLLLLNTSLERGAYQVTALRDQAAQVTLRQQGLQMQVAALQDPQVLARKAIALGMVQDPSPAFLSLRTGQLIGHPVAGVAGNQFDVGPLAGVRVDHLSKLASVAGGQAAGHLPPVVVAKVHHGGSAGAGSTHAQKSGDTGSGATVSKAARDTKGQQPQQQSH